MKIPIFLKPIKKKGLRCGVVFHTRQKQVSAEASAEDSTVTGTAPEQKSHDVQVRALGPGCPQSRWEGSEDSGTCDLCNRGLC